MKPQLIKSPSGDCLAVLTLEEYESLRAQADGAEDWEDLAIFHERMRDLETAKDQVLPEEVSRNLMLGDSLVTAVRRWRGMTSSEVAKKARIDTADLPAIEARETPGAAEVLSRIAAALDVPATWLLRNGANF